MIMSPTTTYASGSPHLQYIDGSSPGRREAAEAAGQVDFLPFFTVGALSVLTWDILSELGRDIHLLRSVRSRGLRGAPYILARCSMLALALTEAVSQTVPLRNCYHIRSATGALFTLSISTTYLLIFFRMRSAFARDTFISSVFSLLWILLIAASSTIIYGVSVEHVSPASINVCATLLQKIKPYVAAAQLGPLVYICLVYVFQSARLVSSFATRMDVSIIMRGGVREFARAQFLPIVSRGMFQEGQEKYLVAVIFQLVSFIIFLAGGTTPSSHTRFILLNSSVVITHIMACKVYRENLQKEENEKMRINVEYPAQRLLPLVYLNLGGDSTPQASQVSYSTSNNGGVKVTKTVERF